MAQYSASNVGGGSGSLTFDPDRIEPLAGNIATSKENFDKSIGAIESANTRLTEAWSGTASSAYTENLTTQITAIKKLSELLGYCADYLNEAAATYRETESANTLGSNQ